VPAIALFLVGARAQPAPGARTGWRLLKELARDLEAAEIRRRCCGRASAGSRAVLEALVAVRDERGVIADWNPWAGRGGMFGWACWRRWAGALRIALLAEHHRVAVQSGLNGSEQRPSPDTNRPRGRPRRRAGTVGSPVVERQRWIVTQIEGSEGALFPRVHRRHL
jgi:hypothetical protein